MSTLSAEVVAAIDDLELVARLVVEGLRAGGHRSPFHGFSAEFQQHRPYRSGDDLKYLDWKILARTNRLYTRQFRETTSMPAMLVLDSSASMAFPADGVSKFRYSAVLAAALSYMVSTQGDAVGLMTMDGERLSYLPARGGKPHLRAVISRLDSLATGRSWDAVRVINRAAELLKRRGALLVISDFYDNEVEVMRTLRRVARSGHDVSLIQVLSPEEQSLPFKGDLEFEDLELGTRRLVNSRDVAARYAKSVEAFVANIRKSALAHGMTHTLASTELPPGRVLRHFLLARLAEERGGHHVSQLPR